MNRISFSTIIFMVTLLALPGCSFVGGQLRDKAMEEKLLRPGALDPGIPKSPYYVWHTFKLVNRYQVTHEWPGIADSCQYTGYFGKPPGLPIRLRDSNGDIYERDGHTFLKGDSRYTGKNYKDELMDRFVRPEYTVIDVDGKLRTAKGLEPMCFSYWLRTQHVLKIDLRKQSIDEQLAASIKSTPEASISKQRVGDNTWHVVTSSLGLAPLNGVGGPYQKWILPIGDTGYIFIFGLGANQDSLQYPAAHAQMQEIFRHLIESVKIEPIQP